MMKGRFTPPIRLNCASAVFGCAHTFISAIYIAATITSGYKA